MAQVEFHGQSVHLSGELPAVGTIAPDFVLVAEDLSEKSLADFAGKRLVLNVFPSVDTGVCAASVRRFNEEASGLENTIVLNISADLPFALKRFCAAEGLERVVNLSAFRSEAFKKDYGLAMEEGALKGLLARAVLVLDAEHRIVHAQLSPVISEAVDFDAALKALA